MKMYIDYLKRLVNYERESEIQQMINEIKKLSPYKREILGRAINNLKGKVLNKELGFIIAQYGRKEVINTEINVGDVVLISKGNPLKSDLTGTVTEKGKRFIKVALEHVPLWALKKDIRIDLYVSDITFKRMEDNLKNLSQNGLKALEFIKETKKPSKISNDTVKISEIKDKYLNSSQKKCIEKSLNTEDFFLIHGPFGTGKTRTIIELINQYSKGKKILVTAESNCAVDNILEILSKTNDKIISTRLGHPQRTLKENIENTLAYKFEMHPLNLVKNKIEEELNKKITERDEFTKPTPQYRRGFSDEEIIHNASKNRGSRGINPKKMKSMSCWLEKNKDVDKIQNKIKKIEDKIIKNIIEKSDVILSTNSSAASEYIENIIFDLAIIDEGSQSTIPSALIPISKAKKFILAGDHKQLPPVILSKKAKDLENTLFEKLILNYPKKSGLLNVQYRMNEKLMFFPNKEFYGGKLKAAESSKNIGLNEIIDMSHIKERFFKEIVSNEKPLITLDTSKLKNNYEEKQKESKSFINKLEVKIMKDVVKFFLDSGIENKDIGVITPYLDQVNLLKENIDVEVKTVDGFQGREKEIIIISTVRSNKEKNIGFLKNLKRLNVALTRSKRKLIIVGNVDTLISDSTLNTFVNYCKKNDLIVSLKEI